MKTNAHYLQKYTLTNHAKLRSQRGRRDSWDHFLLGSDSLWALKNKSPCDPTPSQGLQQMPVQEDRQAGRRGSQAIHLPAPRGECPTQPATFLE